MKNHYLNVDEANNIIKNFSQLPFKLEEKYFDQIQEHMKKYD